MTFTIEMPAARMEGERLANLAADKAERDEEGFTEIARAFVLQYLGQHGASSGEVITDAAKVAGIRPHDDRAFGAIYAWLSRQNRITAVGWCQRAKGHGTGGGRLWVLAGRG